LEFTSRFGYPTISIQAEGVLSSWGEFLFDIATKKKVELKVKKGFQVGVVVVVPPFPFEDKSETALHKDLSILFKKPNLDGIHLGDVKKTNGTFSIAGDSGYVLVVTGCGITVEGARKQAYSRVNNIMLQNMYYRTDIGEKWLHESDKLQMWGYLY
jgi:phosphoribosylamine---glycine ligase